MCFNSPLISVVMGVRYRREDICFLKRSIQSILKQTYSNFEFLICENDSTEEACRYLQGVTTEDERVRLVDGKGADTLAKKLNRCIQEANGSYIARQDDDDVSSLDRFEIQLDYLQHHAQIAFVGSIAYLEQDDADIGIRNLPEKPQVKDFLFKQPFLHPTLMFQKWVLESCGGYCEDANCAGCEDYDLLLRLYERNLRGVNIQDPCFIYTLPPKGSSNRTWKMRQNEVKTRWTRFRSLGLLPEALPFVIKPLVVGLIPIPLLEKIKEKGR